MQAGLGFEPGDPGPYDLGDGLRAVVRTDVSRLAAQAEQIREDIDHVDLVSLRATRMARHARVNASTTLSTRRSLLTISSGFGRCAIASVLCRPEGHTSGRTNPRAAGQSHGFRISIPPENLPCAALLCWSIDRINHRPKQTLKTWLGYPMDKSEKTTLTQFAISLLERARIENTDVVPQTFGALPQNTSNDALHAALIVQSDLIEMLTARFAAELSVVTAAMERMERDLAIAKGQVARLSDLQSLQEVETQRALLEARDLAETYVDRLTENFEHRLRTLA